MKGDTLAAAFTLHGVLVARVREHMDAGRDRLSFIYSTLPAAAQLAGEIWDEEARRRVAEKKP